MKCRSRTQAERRAATIDALLEATIRALSEVGYGALTTRGVAQSAGVSQGAQQHYFPTKSALVTAAMERLIEQLTTRAMATPVRAESERDRALELLDRLWELHTLPICPAVLELYNAARTDAELAQRVSSLTRIGMESIRSVAAQFLPTCAQAPGFADFVDVATSTMRGTVVLTSVPGLADAHPGWPRIRTMLMQLLEVSTGTPV
ncbi:TetR/AcrR family transcriptional regulator [Nocardia stercoris]|uniref:TetR family transcriptional regulator n=1 Tax=Nocardia stercoris TaxID=2483361 RepID=A0A3M2L4X0_9NOCA|nr:TetR/AcrR family transcriptional regulator [Nocardia stercoris]RMI32709.1 TetR family transcriptional regulator [Nocardia stercoris]